MTKKWIDPKDALPYDDKRYDDKSVTVYLLVDGLEVPGYYDRRLNSWYCYNYEDRGYIRLTFDEVQAWRSL